MLKDYTLISVRRLLTAEGTEEAQRSRRIISNNGKPVGKRAKVARSGSIHNSQLITHNTKISKPQLTQKANIDNSSFITDNSQLLTLPVHRILLLEILPVLLNIFRRINTKHFIELFPEIFHVVHSHLERYFVYIG